MDKLTDLETRVRKLEQRESGCWCLFFPFAIVLQIAVIVWDWPAPREVVRQWLRAFILGG